MNILVIGYGNPLRGDDGFGYRVAERVPGAIAAHQLTPELMDAIARADRVVFVDASCEGEPGEIRRRSLSPQAGGCSFTHHLTPENLLAGSLALYGRAPEAEVITVCGADFSLSEKLSEKIRTIAFQITDLLADKSGS